MGCEDSILLRYNSLHLESQSSSIKISLGLSEEADKVTVKYIRESRGCRITKTILQNSNQVGGSALSDFNHLEPP